MMFPDLDTIVALAQAGGRPQARPGFGMLEAVKSVSLRGPGGESIEVTAGVSRVASRHWAIRRHPVIFRVVDSRDKRTVAAHSRALAHVRAELERGRTAAPGTRSYRPLALPSVLPAPTTDKQFRLPPR